MEHGRPANYATRQGKRILDYLESLGGRHVTVYEAARFFAGEGEGIGQTTIYRHLEKLTEEGKLRKYILNDGKSACYQYVDDGAECREHFHLKCEKCGTLIHLECDVLKKIRRHIFKEHRFRINALKTVFYGRCEHCLDGDGP
ncbi:MAG: transcriptional repressor [Treponema sp.]|jgi:Fur family ferric uptake transcriptional regulator|nr:transcriptional repressor [Treponema sp.]